MNHDDLLASLDAMRAALVAQLLQVDALIARAKADAVNPNTACRHDGRREDISTMGHPRFRCLHCGAIVASSDADAFAVRAAAP